MELCSEKNSDIIILIWNKTNKTYAMNIKNKNSFFNKRYYTTWNYSLELNELKL